MRPAPAPPATPLSTGLAAGTPGLATVAPQLSTSPRPESILRAPAPSSPFKIKLSVDLPLTATGLVAGFVLPQLISSSRPEPAALQASQVNGMDRSVIGNWSPTADYASTGLLTAGIVLPFAASLIDTWVNKPSDGYAGFFKDALVLAETYAITNMLTTVVKLSVNRPRPYLYDPSAPAEVWSRGDATHSFFSGHTATAFAMATSYSYLFTLRHPHSRWRIPIWIGTHAMAAATGFLRVEAGHHFWSDVLVGAAVGSAIGLLVPYLHTENNFFSRLLFGRKKKDGTSLRLSIGNGLGLSGTF